MDFAKRVWRLLVAVKDGLVLLALLLFFGALAAALSSGAAPLGHVADGALRIALRGQLVEEKREPDGLGALLDGGAMREIRERDVVRALRAAIDDPHIKAVAIDLSGFLGGGIVHLQEIGAAMDGLRAAHKPVLAYGYVLEDGGTLIAAHASEAWIDPMGGAFLPGIGGERLYFAKLLDRFGITAHVFRVGTYKDFVEPYTRSDASPASKAATRQLYDAVWAAVAADISRARPKAQVARVIADPVGWFKAAGGDGAKAALGAGLVDRIGTRAEFGARLAQLAGADPYDKRTGAYAHTDLAAFLAAHPLPRAGKAIGIVTVAGEIVDGKAGPGTAGGDRIAALIDRAVADRSLVALVVRVDSPGGAATAGETIRQALQRARAAGLPIVVSMANYAASGGYWVSTPGAKIFAAPTTITGSIGIFAIIPSFEKLLGKYGVTADGYRTTPIAGQPDPFAGLTPAAEAMLQAEIDNGYARFLGIVAQSRHRTPAAIDAIAQGRAWDGASALRLGLIDGFGGLDAALGAAASAAHLDPDPQHGAWHAVDLAGARRRGIFALLAALRGGDDGETNGDSEGAARDWVGLVAAHQRAALAASLAQVARLGGGAGAQAYCLACVGLMPPSAPPAGPSAPSASPSAAMLALLARGL